MLGLLQETCEVFTAGLATSTRTSGVLVVGFSQAQAWTSTWHGALTDRARCLASFWTAKKPIPACTRGDVSKSAKNASEANARMGILFARVASEGQARCLCGSVLQKNPVGYA